MNKVLLVIAVLTISACRLERESFKKFYVPKIGDKYSFCIPSGYVSEKRYQGGSDYAQEYLYSDSSMFYVTTFSHTPNYEELMEQDTSSKRFLAYHYGDTITLEGIDEQGLYWKDRLLRNGITIGYTQVVPSRKKEFDKCVSSIESAGWIPRLCRKSN